MLSRPPPSISSMQSVPPGGADPWEGGAPWPWLPPASDEPPKVVLPALSRRRGWTLAAMVTLLMSVSFLDRQALSALAPTVTEALGLSNAQYGLLGAAFALAYLLGAPAAGFMLDRFGARRGLLLSLIAWSIASASHTLVTGFGQLVALRVALGLTEAPSFPGAAQIIQRALPDGRSRMRAVGLLFTGSSFGAFAAPFLANAFAGAYGWRFAFVGTALVGLAWMPLWLVVSGGRARAVLDTPVGPRAAAALNRSVWSYSGVWRSFVATFALAPVVGFSVLWLAKFLAFAHGLSPQQAAIFLAPPALCFDLGSVLFGYFASRSPKAARACFSVAAALASLMGGLAFMSTPLTVSALCCLSLVGVGGALAVVTGQLIASVPSTLVSSSMAIGGAAAQSLALIIAMPLIGTAVDRTGSYVPALLSIAASALIGAGLWLSWRPEGAVRAKT